MNYDSMIKTAETIANRLAVLHIPTTLEGEYDDGSVVLVFGFPNSKSVRACIDRDGIHLCRSNKEYWCTRAEITKESITDAVTTIIDFLSPS